MTNENVLVQSSGGSPPRGPREWVEVEFAELATISDRANWLLSKHEDFDVAFKKTISALESDDLVSFANSRNGGTILIGVNRIKYGSGRQRASLVGCPVGDRERLKILAKASQCVPPVPVSVFVENSADKPFYRIEVASGRTKPYCTSGGTYKIRGDGRNEMLYPAQLLALFLAGEGKGLLQAAEGAEAPGHLNRPVWSIESSIRASLGQLAEAASTVECDAGSAGSVSEDGAETSVRLCSQDLCGFLMRLS